MKLTMVSSPINSVTLEEPMRQKHLWLVILLLVLCAATQACTFKHVQSTVSTAPPERYTTVAVGSITSEDKLYENLAAHFRRGFVEAMGELKAFETIQDPAPGTLQPSSVLVSGTLTEINKGSEALRWIIGFGAGRASITGNFAIRNAKGETLAQFDAREAYAGGLGIGGAGFLDMEDLARRFGKTVAKRTVQWSRGEKFD